MKPSQAPHLMAAEDTLLVAEAKEMRDEQLRLAESARARSKLALASERAHIAAAGMIQLLIGEPDSIPNIAVTTELDADPYSPASVLIGARTKAAPQARPSVTVKLTPN